MHIGILIINLSNIQRNSKDIETRKKLAKEEIESWRGYVETRKSELPEVCWNNLCLKYRNITSLIR